LKGIGVSDIQINNCIFADRRSILFEETSYAHWNFLIGTDLDLKGVFYPVNVKIKIHSSHSTLKSRPSVGPIDEVVQVGQVVSKGIFMDIVETFYVCREADLNNQINYKSALCYNDILKFIIQQKHSR
jgi:hypothetical protein